MTVLHLLHLENTPILSQLQIEEALLRVDQRNWCIINSGSPPAIVLGISGKPEELIHLEKMQQTSIPLIRRFSGGGTVVIDENTCFVTFICNTSCIPIQPFPEHIMRWTEQIYQSVFHPHPFRLKENDYVIGNHKCGGNAQSICKNRWLHHSSLLWDYCPNKMDYLLLPKKMPNYREKRSHTDFLCCLRDYWPQKHLFINQLLDIIHEQFSIQKIEQEQIEDLLKIPHRQTTTVL